MSTAPRLPTLMLAEDLWEPPRDAEDLVLWVSWDEPAERPEPAPSTNDVSTEEAEKAA